MDVVSGAKRRGRGRPAKDRSGQGTVDAHVGCRLQLRRRLLGLSQTELGRRLGLTFQQIQKYERGANGITASRLWHLAGVLDVPVSFFFDGMPDMPSRAPQPLVPQQPSSPGRQEMLELVQHYYRIRDPRVRRKVLDLVKATVEALESGPTPCPSSATGP